MAQVDDVLDNVFTRPDPTPPLNKKEKMAENYKKRYQLLDYDDVTKLSDVMETTVPVDGKGNFPSLEVTPSTLVQMVRDGLSKEGIRVPNVRLNGSAATHVLSDDGNHPYKDLDLIFAVDLSDYSDACNCGITAADFNKNINNNNTYCRSKIFKSSGKTHHGHRHNTTAKHAIRKVSQSASESITKIQSSSHDRSEVLPLDDTIEREIPESKDTSSNDSTPKSASPQTVLEKAVNGEETPGEDADVDSGYISSGSSVASLPVSPAGSWVFQHPTRSRTHSLDSASSITSSSSGPQGPKHKECPGQHLEVQPRNGRRDSGKDHVHEICPRSKDACWQKIKDVVMTILRDLLPAEVIRSRMTDAMLKDAYVQKMVKITNDMDRWSLISLNNNAGRNLELKFVENMRRQYEFSVDSFQIILDSYQRFKIVSRSLEDSEEIKLSPNFYPSVLAESVYGDFQSALRHLRHRRICTRKPEEIRGGGLLRYCNLRLRDFTPGEVEGHEGDVMDDVVECDDGADPFPSHTRSYSTSRPDDVSRLEQLMCSRFFIDFNELQGQQQKLLSYLDSHFVCEEDLKLQYLLIVRQVVAKGTVCLMSNERFQIVDFIKTLALDTFAKIVSCTQSQPVPQLMESKPPGSVYENTRFVPYTPSQSYVYPQQIPAHWNTSNINNLNGNYCNQYAQGHLSQPNYASGCFYPQHQHSSGTFYPSQNLDPSYPSHCEGYSMVPPKIPIALCPCCRSTYPQAPNQGPFCAGPQVVVTPPQHTMSVNSPPFYPASKSAAPVTSPDMSNAVKAPLVYIRENATLIYSKGPPPSHQGGADAINPPHSAPDRTEPSETGISSHSKVEEQ